MSELNQSVKRVFLAGVGMVTEACDFTKEELEKLAAKGNQFLDNQGEKTKKWFDDMVKRGSEVMGTAGVENEPLHKEEEKEGEQSCDLSAKIREMSAEELAKLREEIDRAAKERADAKE